MKQLRTMPIRDVAEIAYSRPKRRGTKYQAIFGKMERLVAGQGFLVPVPKGLTSRSFNNQLNAAISREGIQPPIGCMFTHRTLEGNRVSIICVKEG